MGFWGAGAFENDSATDWSGELAEAEPAARLTMIRQALAGAADEGDYLQVDSGAEAVAAAAIVAAQLPDADSMTLVDLPDFVTRDFVPVDAELRRLAVRALDRAAGQGSELMELLREDRAFADGFAAMRAQMRSVLGGA
jgi:hypothetical protein